MLESEIQTQILDYLKARGILRWRCNLGGVRFKGGKGRNPMTGFPDIAGICPHGHGRFFTIEVKAKKGVMSPEQLVWRTKLEAKGVVYILARSVDDVAVVFRSLTFEFGA